jgi:hypothetical protein
MPSPPALGGLPIEDFFIFSESIIRRVFRIAESFRNEKSALRRQ